MTRKPLIAGNWKMHATCQEAEGIARAVVQGVPPQAQVEVVLCPPFTALAKVAELLKGTGIGLGAQNVHWDLKGAFTGEVSAPMLKEVGCRYCIIGHSERRHGMGETDTVIQRKLHALVGEGMGAILCVGETLQERQGNQTWAVVEGQLKAALDGLSGPQAERQLVIAYEPVWAIGTGQNATGPQAQEVQGQIREFLASRWGGKVAEGMRILYGGSVKAENAAELLSQTDLDGALVGGASLDPQAFLAIAQAAVKVKSKGSPCSTA